MIRCHATYYLNYTAYWCNARISTLLSIGIPTPQLLYTIPNPALFLGGTMPSDSVITCACEFWQSAIKHCYLQKEKKSCLSLSLCVYLYAIKQRIIYISQCQADTFTSCKKMLFNVEGTNISKCHVFEVFRSIELVSHGNRIPSNEVSSAPWETKSFPLLSLPMKTVSWKDSNCNKCGIILFANAFIWNIYN